MVENKPNSKLKIVAATKKDVSLILAFIKELAEFEKLSNDVLASEEFLTKTLFVSGFLLCRIHLKLLQLKMYFRIVSIVIYPVF